MPLLEIIPHAGTSEETQARAMDLGLRQGKTCIVVKDVPGFFVNRCLGPYLAETLALVQRGGVDPVRLDAIMTSWGLPVGPIALADEVGLDVAAHVNESLSGALGVRMGGGDAQLFRDMIAAGFLGKKSGSGFFMHGGKAGKKAAKGGKKEVNPQAVALLKAYQSTGGAPALSDETVVDRLMSRFVNEAALCVQDEIIGSPSEGDMGAVFGMGFPPFLGGPFRYVDLVGSSVYVDKMMRFAESEGEQFEPCALLKDMAKTNKKFYS
jgi:enoyl-CoA hydratase/long-chain 3-hydroxyacyl-CoA dehydrogenase